MNKHLLSGIAATTFAATMALTAPASAAVQVDLDTLTGFVGKGDVQLETGWNNAQLQTNAGSVDFEVRIVATQDADWTCSRLNNGGKEVTLEKTTIINSTTSKAADTVARDKKGQITGFNLNGIASVSTPPPTTEGPAVGACAEGAGAGWTASEVTYGDPVTESKDLYLLAGGNEYILSNS